MPTLVRVKVPAQISSMCCSLALCTSPEHIHRQFPLPRCDCNLVHLCSNIRQAHILRACRKPTDLRVPPLGRTFDYWNQKPTIVRSDSETQIDILMVDNLVGLRYRHVEGPVLLDRTDRTVCQEVSKGQLPVPPSLQW